MGSIAYNNADKKTAMKELIKKFKAKTQGQRCDEFVVEGVAHFWTVEFDAGDRALMDDLDHCQEYGLNPGAGLAPWPPYAPC